MRQKLSVLAASFVVIPSVAFAHATVAPRESASFVFVAKNPTPSGQITWKVQQRFADGKSSNWTPGTKLTETPATAAAPAPAAALQAGAAGGADAAAVQRWLAEYDAAFNAKNLEKLGTFYHPEVTIYEGGGINRGWADYRDNHLGPELKEFANLQFAHSNIVVRMVGPDAAYATSEYSLKARMGERDIDSGGLETLVLVKDGGAWRIRHSHTSSRPRRPAAGR